MLLSRKQKSSFYSFDGEIFDSQDEFLTYFEEDDELETNNENQIYSKYFDEWFEDIGEYHECAIAECEIDEDEYDEIREESYRASWEDDRDDEYRGK